MMEFSCLSLRLDSLSFLSLELRCAAEIQLLASNSGCSRLLVKNFCSQASARLRATHLSNIRQPIRGQLQREPLWKQNKPERERRMSECEEFFFSFLKLMQNFSKETRDQRHAEAYMNK